MYAIRSYYDIPKKFAELSIEDLESSIYKFMEKNQLKIKSLKKEYLAIVPDTKIRDVLKIRNNTAVFKIEYTNFIQSGEVFQYTKVYYNQNRITSYNVCYTKLLRRKPLIPLSSHQLIMSYTAWRIFGFSQFRSGCLRENICMKYWSVFLSCSQADPENVITSYSIHYTKLYQYENR